MGSRVLDKKAEIEDGMRVREATYNQQRTCWSKGQYQIDDFKGELLDKSQSHKGEREELRLRNILLAKKVTADKVKINGLEKLKSKSFKEVFLTNTKVNLSSTNISNHAVNHRPQENKTVFSWVLQTIPKQKIFGCFLKSFHV